jgi:Lysozyme like domain
VSSPCTGTDGGGPGTRYTFAELEGLWINAGGSSALAATMAAVALAESGGCTSDLNTTDNGGRQTSWGLWQISNGTHSSPGANWNTGAGNAALAVAKLKAQGLGAWGTYTSGVYKQFLNGAAPDTSVNGGASGGAAGSGSSATLTAADTSADCLISFPQGKVLFIGTVGGGCLLSKPQARGITGAAVMVNGGVIMLAGLLVLAAYGLRSSGAGRAAGTLLETAGAGAAVAGADRAAIRLHGAGGRVRSQGAGGAARSAAVGGARSRVAAQQAATRQQAASQRAAARQSAAAQRQAQRAAQRAAQQPSGRHAKTGPNSPSQRPSGRHARPGP